MKDTNKLINYSFFHWGPFLYKTSLTKEEVILIKKLCSKESPDYRKSLAGLIKQEHKIDVKKLFPIISPYMKSYVQAYSDYAPQILANKIELKSSWVNYMTKFESNPLHTHDENLSFVIFIQVPKNLKEEYNKTHSPTSKPGTINFVYTLGIEEFNINKHSFFPEVGDFYIFPASLHHYVNSFQSNGERISVSGNLKTIKLYKKKKGKND